MSKTKMKKFCIFCACVALAGFVSCQKQQTEEERKAEIDRQVEQRLAAERQAQEKETLAQRESEVDAREKALAEQQNAATQTPRPRSTSSTRTTRESSEESPNYNIFYTKLEPYGEWRETSDYGYVWQPREAERSRNWHPYTSGRWVYTDAGWTWISEEPFGWATYHYGRWARLRNVGWVWVPGDEWAPAWVSWRKSDEYVGWAPLPPEARFDRRRGIHNWADNYYDIGPDQYRFVATREFGNKEIERTVVPRERNVTIINQTTNITNITYSNTTVVNQGPNYDEVRTRSQQPIERLRLERDVNVNLNVEVGRPVVRGEVIALPAPMIAIGRPVERPRTVKAAIAQTVIEHGWEDIGDRQAAEQARTKMKSESTPPPDAPSKTFVKPEVASAQASAAGSVAPVESASPTTTPARARPTGKPLVSATPPAGEAPSATPAFTPARPQRTETPTSSATRSATGVPSATPTSTPEQSAPGKLTETASPTASPTATPKVKPSVTLSPSSVESSTPAAIIKTPPRKMTPLPTSASSPSVSPSNPPTISPTVTATISPSVSPNESTANPERPKTFGPRKSLAHQLEPVRTVPMSSPASPSATPSASPATSTVTTPAVSPPARSKTALSPDPKHEEQGKDKRETPAKPGESVSPTPTPPTE
ncbi:MAG: hypothetical protein QOI22_183 [Verrucomicrobiota bacterium]